MENTENDFIALKWGTLKGWHLHNSPEAWEALQKYAEIGSSVSRMMQRDTPEQKKLICEMIDKVNGRVYSDWDGTDYTDDREAAKKYVMEYRS